MHSSTTSKIYQAQLTPTSGGARYKKKRMARGAKKDKKGSKKKDKEAVASSDDEANLDFEIDGEDDEFGSDEEGGEKRGKSHKKNAAETMEKWKKNLSAKEIINAKFPVNVDTLFELLFTKSKFYIEFHSARKTFDIVQSPWQPVPNSNDKKREVKLTLSLTHPMGPKHSPVTEMQVRFDTFTSYALQSSFNKPKRYRPCRASSRSPVRLTPSTWTRSTRAFRTRTLSTLRSTIS